jgi:hypothetical protein
MGVAPWVPSQARNADAKGITMQAGADFNSVLKEWFADAFD